MSKWKPGESGNPNGRPPKGEALTEILKEKIDKEAIAEKLIELAMDGDFPALKYVYDRIDGSPKQTIDATVQNLPELIRFDDQDITEDSEVNPEQ